MKRFIFLLAVMAPFAHAAASVDSIPESDLKEQNGLYYRNDADTPFTGLAIVRFGDGQLRSETWYRSGKRDGSSTSWFDDGHVKNISEYREGQRHGEWITWSREHQVLIHHLYENGARIF